MNDEKKPQRFELKSIQLGALKPDGTIEWGSELSPDQPFDVTPEQVDTETISYLVPPSISITLKANYRDVLRALYPGWLDRLWAAALKRFAGRN